MKITNDDLFKAVAWSHNVTLNMLTWEQIMHLLKIRELNGKAKYAWEVANTNERNYNIYEKKYSIRHFLN